MKYVVTFAASVRYKTNIEADNVAEAQDIAWNDFESQDFGKLDFVNSHIDNIKKITVTSRMLEQDENGKFIE